MAPQDEITPDDDPLPDQRMLAEEGQPKKKGVTLGVQQKTYTNALGQHIALSLEVFEQTYGAGWNSQRAAKEMTTMDFSGSEFMLETLEGPEMGILRDDCRACRSFIRTLIVSNNALTDINCIDRRRPRTTIPEFPVLNVLIASRNQILDVKLNLEHLYELNLAYNELELMPDTSGLPALQKLVLPHNKIRGSLKGLSQNKRLRELLIHDNSFSWKPTEFEAQMNTLKSVHLYRLTIWPNPFAHNFPEYQFLACTIIDTLQILDGYDIDQDLKLQLQSLEEDMRAKQGLDFSIFDIKVAERTNNAGLLKGTELESVSRSQIPNLAKLLTMLERPLDHPDELIKHVYDFAGQINYLWNASYVDRQSRMQMDIKDQDLKVQVREFGDKMQQLLGRFDSVQDVLVKCLVRLCASGSRPLSEQCAILLAEWIDALPPELSEKLQSISTPLFRELRVRMLPGMQSFQDNPEQAFQASFPELMEQSPEIKDLIEEDFFGKKSSIAETAEILSALGKFGRAGFAQRPVHNNRALVLRPLIPALCRHSRKALGEEQERDDIKPYVNFKPFDGAELSAQHFQGPKVGFEDVCKSRAAKQNCGGFVVSEVPSSSSLRQAQFVHEAPDAIRGMRVPCEGQILWVMPAVAQERESREGELDEAGNLMTWDVWHNCLNVLCVATTDPENAARCVLKYGIHKDIFRYVKDVFSESLLNIANEASLAFTSLLSLARNLMNATKTAAQEARNEFTDRKLHIECWSRLRTRLAQVKTAKAEQMMLLSAMVRVVFEMSKGERGKFVTADLSEGMDDVFNTMLEIAGDTEAPDPLMLSASLETLWMFLNHENTRAKVVNKVITKLHDLAIMLPYIKGPIIGDVDNNKYQDLWRMCEVKYGSDLHGAERFPQLFEGKKNTEWRKKVPEIKDMRNPLMHRVMLGVVRLIELISDKADLDATGEFKRVTDMLDRNNREDMLIGPQNGLILVPDFDVKIEVLRVIGHVLDHQPGQFNSQELGWILRYLQSKNLGYGRQEEFLIEVLKIVTKLIEDNGYVGFIFRQQFAKSAIRQAYEMLKVNSARETSGGHDAEQSKTALSLEIVALLGTCSKPRSGGLRPFLRRVDFLETVKAVMKEEDGKAFGIREPLLRTWTGRNMREVLMPLVTHNELDVKGLGRYRSLVRMADVLQGKMDYDRRGRVLKSTDESIMWPGPNAIQQTLVEHDDYLRKDTEQQQRDFLSGGLDGVLGFAERLLYSSSIYSRPYAKAITDVKVWSANAGNRVYEAWLHATGASKKETKKESQEEPQQPDDSKLESLIYSRLACVNNRIQARYKANLSNFSEKTGLSSLTKIAQVLKKEVEENMKLQIQYYDDDEWEELAGEDVPEDLDNQYNIAGKLFTMAQIKEDKKKLEKCRQSTGDLKELVVEAHMAQTHLKSYLLARGEAAVPATEKWAKEKWEVGDEPEEMSPSVNKGLIDFLMANACSVYDPGIVPKEVIKRMSSYKYHDDLTRVRNMARLVIEVKDVPAMKALVKGLKNNTRFQLLMIRNRFKYPTALGGRFIQVFVDVVIGSSRHIAELKLVIQENGPGGYMLRENNLRTTMEQTINAHCQVDSNKITEITEFLIYEMHSRSIRSGDVLYIQSSGIEKYLAIDIPPKEMVGVRSEDEEPLNQMNLFYIHRKEHVKGEFTDEWRDAPGPLRTGDIISLESYFSKKYIDISSTNHGIRARYDDPDSEESNLKMIVEAAPEKKPEGIVGLSAFAAIDEVEASSKLPKDQKKKKHIHKEMPKNVHNATSIMLKVYGASSPQRRITVRKAASWRDDRQGLKAEPRYDDELADPQIFVFFREGNLSCFFEAPNMRTAEDNAKCISGAQTEEQRQDSMLLHAYMAGDLQLQAPLEGGTFRREPPTFEDIVLKEAQSKSAEALEEEEDAAQGRHADVRKLSPHDLQKRLAPMTMAAVCRCVYALIEAPAFPEARAKTLDEVLGTPDSHEKLTKMSRLLAVAIAGCSNSHDVVDYDTLCYASLSAKILRMFSKCLKNMPPNSMPAQDNAPAVQNESWKQKQREKEESGEYDKQRITVLQIFSDYIKQILVPPLLTRLAVASQRPLNKGEVMLLKELGACVVDMGIAFFGNELRCKAEQKDDEDDDGTKPQEAIADSGGGGFSLGDMGGGGMLSLSEGGDVQELMKQKGQILGEQAAAIFASIVPPEIVRVLVHAMLYGMRREAQAYTHKRNIGEVQDSVKLMSSLVQQSVHALAITMQGCEGTEFACDYNVCEAISQAMCAGGQMISRARVTQLMVEWHTEKYRKAAQDKFDAGDVDEAGDVGPSEDLSAMPTERVSLVAYAWVGFVTDESVAYQEDFKRKLVVITSRLNIAIFSLDAEQNEDGSLPPPDQDQLTFDSFRDLSWLKGTINHPRMCQLMSLVWKEGKSGSATGETHEVFIFECHTRKVAFREALRQVVKFREKKIDPVTGVEEDRPDELEKGPDRHVPEMLPHVRFSLRLRKNCKDPTMQRSLCQLVTVTFIRSIANQESKIEVMILTRDAIVTISLLQFLKAYNMEVIGNSDHTPELGLVNVDSDDDADGLPPMQELPQMAEMDDMQAMPNVRGVWALKDLQGVWFMAAEEPKMKVNFGSESEIHFFSEGARQRFRQHLACTLKCGEEDNVEVQRQEETGKKWKVQPTRKENMPEVKKELKETEKSLVHHLERLKVMEALAVIKN